MPSLVEACFSCKPPCYERNVVIEQTGMSQILFAQSAELIKFRLQNSRNAVSKLPGLTYRSALRFACAARRRGITIARVTIVQVAVVHVRWFALQHELGFFSSPQLSFYLLAPQRNNLRRPRHPTHLPGNRRMQFQMRRRTPNRTRLQMQRRMQRRSGPQLKSRSIRSSCPSSYAIHTAERSAISLNPTSSC